VKTSFSLSPFNSANGPSGCPPHLLHVSKDGTSSPVELLTGAFDLFEGMAHQWVFWSVCLVLNSSMNRLILSAMQFKELWPFVNVSATPHEWIYAKRFKHHVMWQGLNCSVLFTMLGSVQTCNLVKPTSFGQYIGKAITIIPYGEAWRTFQVFLSGLYGQGQMRGPFEYGCLLTLSSRHEGYSLGGKSFYTF